MIIMEFVRLVDQRVEESGINRTLLIRNSGMKANGISQILTKGRGHSPYVNHVSVALDVSPEKLFRLAGYLSSSRTGRCNGE